MASGSSLNIDVRFKKRKLFDIDYDKEASILNWSDDILMQLRERVKFQESTKNRVNLKKIISRFYRFYFTGIIYSELDESVVAVVADACALARTSEGPIWPDEVFGTDAFYKLNTSAEEQISPTNLSALVQSVELISGMSEVRGQYETFTSKNIPDHAVNFAHEVHEIFSKIDPTREATDAELRLIQLTGFLALTFWRAAIKNKNQLCNAFLNTQYRANLTSLAGWPIDKPFAPPCNQCLKLLELALSKSMPSTSPMFTLLVSEYVRNRRNNTSDASATLLNVTVLTHTAQNGLGIFQLLERALNVTKVKWTELFELSNLNLTADSWDLIKKFYSTYHDENNPQYGFNWARIINDRYLRGYSPKEMLPLAGILAGIIEQQEGQGIWNAVWAKGRKEWLSDMRIYGETLYEIVNKKADGPSPCK